MSTQNNIPIPLIEFISVSTETKLALPVVSENISDGLFPYVGLIFMRSE